MTETTLIALSGDRTMESPLQQQRDQHSCQRKSTIGQGTLVAPRYVVL
jgi:hypothetical protein